MIGIPLTMGFVSKYRFALAAFSHRVLIIPTLIVLALSTVLNGLYFLRVVISLYNPLKEPRRRLPFSKQAAYAVSAVLFCLLNLAAGVAAEPLLNLLQRGIDLL